MDLLKTEDGHGHVHQVIPDDAHFVPHKNGLDKSDMRKAFDSAALASFYFDAEALVVKRSGHGAHQQDVRVFVAKGLKSEGISVA